ncbi:MAG: hypothetical protein AB1898_23765 [Acidobacteriota bacterium]
MKTDQILPPPKVYELLREAAAWRLISLLFECPSGNWAEQVHGLARELEDPRLRQAAEASREEASEGLYHSILGPGGPVSPREVSYHETIQLGYLLSELEAYYRAFAYTPATQEARDHVSVEAGFVSYLRLKEAFALTQSATADAELTGQAAQSFQHNHLALMAEALVERLRPSGVRYLNLTAEALLSRTGPRPGFRVLKPEVEEWALDEPFVCG